jgi:hypothetical protein
MWKKYNLPDRRDLLLVRSGKSFLLAGKVLSRFPLFLETMEGETVVGLAPDDCVAVSAPEGGSPDAAAMLIELVRSHQTPLIILPKGHPGSSRLKYVVSAGEVIRVSCTVERGTHPEQDILCGSDGLSGMTLRGTEGGLEVFMDRDAIEVSVLRTALNLQGDSHPATPC